MAEEPGQENRDAPSNEDKSSRGLLIGFAIAGAILLVVILWVWVNPSDPKEKKDFIQAVGVLLAALAGLGGLYFTRENTEKQLRQARKSQEETQRLTEQGQITERFTRAIEQLGATDDKGEKKLEIRLGGIYALERIDKESPDRAYHSTVMEVLTAYVRENSRWKPKEASTSTATSHEDAQRNKEGAEPTLRRLPADIRAILDVLKRREEHRVLLDLRGADLQGADLQGADLQGADLQEAILRKTMLKKADLREADLKKAILREADLQGAKLNGANFREANLKKAILQEAKLQRAKLTAANLQGTNLKKADFQSADLKRADFRRKANVSGANLQEAALQGANLQEAILRGTDLKKAILQGAILQGADLRGADLQGADLQGAKVTDEQLADTRSLKAATMPTGQKYEDWLEDKEGSGKDVEHE